MNKSQTNQFSMFLTVQAYLDNNTSVWTVVPRLLNYKNLLDEVISRIQSKSQSTAQGVGVSQEKDQLKNAIAIKGSMLSGIIQVIANEQNNADLANAIKMTKSDIIALREVDVDASVKNIIAKANEHLETIAEFAVTPEVIDELSTSLDDYNALIGKPRTILSQKYAALSNIEALFDEGNNILKLKLDNTMLIYRETQVEFYTGYQNARTIIDN